MSNLKWYFLLKQGKYFEHFVILFSSQTSITFPSPILDISLTMNQLGLYLFHYRQNRQWLLPSFLLDAWRLTGMDKPVCFKEATHFLKTKQEYYSWKTHPFQWAAFIYTERWACQKLWNLKKYRWRFSNKFMTDRSIS